MANKALFKSRGISCQVPQTDTVNEAGGRAYSLPAKHALAQYVATGTFGNTYYTTATEQLQKVESLIAGCDSMFLAKLALYGREIAKMKDTPAYILATLTARGDLDLLSLIFDRICNNSKMLFNFCQIIRSGAVGRQSFGSRPKKLIQKWIKSKDPKALYLASIGYSDPSMADVIQMVHPRPETLEEQTIYAYLLNKEREDGKLQADLERLPRDLQIFESLKKGETNEIPDIPFRVLTNLSLSEAQWRQIARNMPWNTLRLNLNQLARRGVFNGRAKGFIKEIAEKLANPELVRKYNVFPYQLMTTYQNMQEIPVEITNALQKAMEVATENVPELPGQTVVTIDVSGSMQSTVTGMRGRGQTSVTRCVDVAALIAACILRNNQNALILAFDCSGGWGNRRGGGEQVTSGLYRPNMNPRDSVMSNAGMFARYGGGGTDCSLPLRWLNQENYEANNVIMVSDNQSWQGRYGSGDEYMTAWKTFRRRNKTAKLINIDIQPYTTTQSPDAKKEILNIAGFSDVVFTMMADFLKQDEDTDFLKIIDESVILDPKAQLDF